MTESDPLSEAVRLLRNERDLLVAEREDIDERLGRIDEGIAVLSELVVRGPRAAAGPSAPRSTSEPGSRPSIRTLLLRLLDEEDRDWSAPEVLAEYQRRGTPLHGKDPSDALRAAIADAFRAGQITRPSRGRYKSAKWQNAPSDATEPTDSRSGDADDAFARAFAEFDRDEEVAPV